MVKPAVLFVCAQNGGRSQRAGALMRQARGDLVEVHTAGTASGTGLDELAVEALAEVGADLSGEQPTPVDPRLPGLTPVVAVGTLLS